MSGHTDPDDVTLTEDLAKKLCQSFRKSWELSLGELGQSCREACMLAIGFSTGLHVMLSCCLDLFVVVWRQWMSA